MLAFVCVSAGPRALTALTLSYVRFALLASLFLPRFFWVSCCFGRSVLLGVLFFWMLRSVGGLCRYPVYVGGMILIESFSSPAVVLMAP